MSEQEDSSVQPASGAEWTQADIMPLLEHAMQLTMEIGCDCVRDELNICNRDCLGSKIWDAIHRARKLVRARAYSPSVRRLQEIDMRRADGYETYADTNGMPAAMIAMLNDLNYLRSFDVSSVTVEPWPCWRCGDLTTGRAKDDVPECAERTVGEAQQRAQKLVDDFRYSHPPVQSLRFLEWEPLVEAIASALPPVTVDEACKWCKERIAGNLRELHT